MAKYANIIIDISQEKLDKTFQYRVPERLKEDITIGMLVNVPFGKRSITGYVVELTDEAEFDPAKTKEIDSIVENSIPIESQLIALAAWMRSNYGATMNQALKTVIPIKQKNARKEKRIIHLAVGDQTAYNQLAVYERRHSKARVRLLEALIENPQIDYEIVTGKLNVTAAVIRALEEEQLIRIERTTEYRKPTDKLTQGGYHMTLNEQQQHTVDLIAANAASEEPMTCLIHGVTGSGKTEVYMELIARAMEQGKQCIVLIPEIALTYQTVMRFYNRFGDRVSIMNSRMSAGERYDQFERAKKGDVDVMIGPRSALFTPFSNIGYIIIDEEHETTYKSETLPRYHARETAIQRARMCHATVVLGSATPSVDSYYHAKRGEYLLIRMDKRVEDKPLPTCHTIDLREELRAHNYSILSRKLQELMEDRLAKKEQIILFINRRGVSGFVSCRACGHVMKCPHCDVSLSAHNNGKLVCHYCGYEQPAVTTCPECGSPYISGFKAGTQKIEMLVQKRFPDARILRMDMDTTKQKDGHEKILSAFANQEADILIGTQMIVKGHDFPNVTLVGVLAADLSLNVSDYRAPERTFQLLTQAAGRAGRGEKPGEVVIQTYSPKHYSVVAAAKQDYQEFYEEEIVYRQMMCYPPVWNMLVVLCASKVEERADRTAKTVHELLEQEPPEGMRLIGPADAAIVKVNDIYKKVLYIKHADYAVLVQIKDKIEKYMEQSQTDKDVIVQFDFNPMNGF